PAASKLRVPVNFPVATTTEPSQPTPTPSNPEEDDNFDAQRRALTLQTLAPIIADAVARVETKTVKAFANKQNKTPQERTIWANVFAEEQARYVAEALGPVNAVLSADIGKTLDLDRIGQRYAANVRAKVAGTEAKPLADIVRDAIETDTTNNGDTNEEQQ